MKKINTTKNLWLLSLSFFFIFLGFNSLQQYFTGIYYLEGIVNTALISLSLIYFFGMIGDMITPFIMRYFSLKPLIIAGAFSYFIFNALAITRINAVVFIAAIILGIFSGVLWTVHTVYLLKIISKKEYGASYGLLWTFLNFGSGIGIFGVGILLNYTAINYLLIALAFLVLIGVLFLLGLDKVDYKMKESDTFINALKNKNLLMLVQSNFSMSLTIGIMFSIIPLIITAHYKLSDIGYVTPLYYIGPVIFPYIFGKLSDLTNRKVFVYLSFICGILGVGLILVNISLTGLFIAVLLLALFSTVYNTVLPPLLGDKYAKKEVASFIALFRCSSSFGIFVGLFLPLFLSYTLLLILIIITIIISLIILVAYFKKS